MKKKKRAKRTRQYGLITLNVMKLFGGRRISDLNPEYTGDEVLREIDMAVYLMALAHSAGGNGEYFASPATVGKALGRDVGTIRRAMKRLELAKFIIKIGYRIANRKEKFGFTVSTASEGREMIEQGQNLCFSTRTYTVIEPDSYLNYLRQNDIDHAKVVGEIDRYDFDKKPEDFGITLPKKKSKLVLPKKKHGTDAETDPS